tara:strand:+ start:1134 stop:1481 length:348 start_codon:yes stop_codon:yes gene_type:complete
MKTLYKVYFCYHLPPHEQARSPNQYKEFVCITTVDRVAKINEHYSELWGLIIDPCHVTAKGDYIPAEELTESKILQEWEGFDFDALLENIETGEKFWYVTKRDENGVDGYELEAI